ncbi:hypothetical protein Y1Q_0013399 [Alligator mississippiensis]|uniref:Uncharacterized protein n=1 Tax=Alligator mississippiensis TaxID=8496 RepID=A0A151NVP8_ALLMI|nr:hypothetical protein Y1Q_0013399 [Alligator mississippiensis]
MQFKCDPQSIRPIERMILLGCTSVTVGRKGLYIRITSKENTGPSHHPSFTGTRNFKGRGKKPNNYSHLHREEVPSRVGLP